MVELLLAHGADLRAADNSGETPLHLAVDRGYFQLAALLIVRGADVKVRDKSGSAPLDEAARRGFREIAQLLIQHGAPVDQADPVHRLYAAQRGRPQGPPRSGGAVAREGRGSPNTATNPGSARSRMPPADATRKRWSF